MNFIIDISLTQQQKIKNKDENIHTSNKNSQAYGKKK